MTITQEVVNEAHRRHQQLTDRDINDEQFTACRCGKFFASEEEATAHWWRAVRALQRARAS